MTPILIVVFGLPPSTAIGTDLVNAAITKAVGAAQHFRQGTVDLEIVTSLAMGSLPAAILGVGLVQMIKTRLGNNGEDVLTTILAWTLIVVALTMTFRLLFRQKLDRVRRPQSRIQLRVMTAILGFIAGILVSLTSVGAGSIVMVLLVLMYSVSASRLVGTDIVHAAALASISALGHIWAGDVDWAIAIMLLMGSVPGVLLGSRISVRIPQELLRIAMALTLMFSGMRLIVH